MSNRNDKWVRRFFVSDPTLHDKQFTVYKVTSVVFPRGMPEAATKVVIWKRFSDFKKLHDDMKLFCKSLKIQDFPRLEKTTFFKRFDPQVIESRRKTVLTMLEFIADHPLLFTSDLFTKFLQGNNYLTGHDSSANDSLSQDSTLPRISDVDKYPNDSASHCSTDSRCSSAVDNDSAIYSSILSVDVPFIDSPSDSVSNFKIDAKESSYHPKLSADSLLSNPSVESVPSPSVFGSLTAQTHKLVPSAFNICESIQDALDQVDSDITCRISFCQQDLGRFQIIGILKHLMYVQDTISKRFYVIKGVPKSVDSGDWNKVNILPHCTKNMVRLHSAVETDSSLYLILEYVKHVKLWDHLTYYFRQKSQKNESSQKPIEPTAKSKLTTPPFHSPSHNFKHSNSNESSQRDSYSELIRSYRANSQKISTSLLSVRSKVENTEPTSNNVPENKAKSSLTDIPYLETGLKEEDNFNKLMRKIDLIMENKEKDMVSRSTPDITAPCTKSMLEVTTADGKWLSSSEISTSFSNKFDSSLASIDSISESLDLTSPKFIDESDSSDKTEVERSNFKFDGESITSNKNNLKSSRSSLLPSVTASRENESSSVINPDSDIEVIKNSCYKVLDKIEAVLNKKSDDQPHSDTAEVPDDPVTVNHDGKMAISDTNTDDLIEKAQQLLDSVNETLQQCDKHVIPENGKFTKLIKHHPSFESIFEKSTAKNCKNVAFSAKVRPVLRSTTSEKGLYETKRSEEEIVSLNTDGKSSSNVKPKSSLKDNCDLTVDLTTISHGNRKKSDDWKTAFLGVEHTSLSPQIVMNEESTFNFNMLFADPASITEDKIRGWAAQILIALESLHQRGILCWDLNPNNILLNHDGKIKLTYFYRHCKVLPIWSVLVLEGYYVAPELLVVPPSPPDEAQDWWSFGVLLFHLLTGKSLSSHHPEGIHPHTSLNIPETVSVPAGSLLCKLLKYDPRERLGSGSRGVDEIKSHTFFNNFDWG